MGGGTSTVSATDDVNVPEQLGEQGPLPVIVSVTLVVAAVGCAPNAICHCVLAPGGVIVCDSEAGRALAVIVTAPLKPPVVFSVTIAFALPPGGICTLDGFTSKAKPGPMTSKLRVSVCCGYSEELILIAAQRSCGPGISVNVAEACCWPDPTRAEVLSTPSSDIEGVP